MNDSIEKWGVIVMKLFLCSANAGDYEPTGVVVAETEEEAEEKFKKELDDEGIWHTGSIWAQEVKVDGYEIVLKKI